MAKVSYQLMPPEYEDYFKDNLSPNWRFELPRIMRTERFVSRAKKKALIAQSKFPEIASFWSELSSSQKEAWNEAGAVRGFTGWGLFIQDTSARILKALAGVSDPSLIYQGWVGHLKIEAPASALKIIQPHPSHYFVARVIAGRSPLIELVFIYEAFSLPLKIGLSYRSEISSVSSPHSASFYAVVWSVFQGEDIYTTLKIPLSYNLGWTKVEKTLEDVPGVPVGYDLFFDFQGVRGNFFFDNLIAEHSGFNWARDPHAEKIDAEFSKSFFQVLRNWIDVDVPVGALS